MPLYNNVIRNLDKEDRKDEDKWSYEFWENVENLPVIKQIGQYNEWTAKNQQALEERARSGELGGFSKALQIGSDVGGAVVGAPFQLIDQGLEAVSDATNIDRRSINTALTIAGLSKAKVIPKGSPLHKSVYSAGQTAKYNVSKNVNRIKTDVGWAKDQIQYATGQKLRPMHKKPNVYTDIAEIIDGPRSLINRAKKIHEYHAGGISFAESMRRARELPDRSSSKYWYQDSELALRKGGITDPQGGQTNITYSTGVEPAINWNNYGYTPGTEPTQVRNVKNDPQKKTEVANSLDTFYKKTQEVVQSRVGSGATSRQIKQALKDIPQYWANPVTQKIYRAAWKGGLDNRYTLKPINRQYLEKQQSTAIQKQIQTQYQKDIQKKNRDLKKTWTDTEQGRWYTEHNVYLQSEKARNYILDNSGVRINDSKEFQLGNIANQTPRLENLKNPDTLVFRTLKNNLEKVLDNAPDNYFSYPNYIVNSNPRLSDGREGIIRIEYSPMEWQQVPGTDRMRPVLKDFKVKGGILSGKSVVEIDTKDLNFIRNNLSTPEDIQNWLSREHGINPVAQDQSFPKESFEIRLSKSPLVSRAEQIKQFQRLVKDVQEGRKTWADVFAEKGIEIVPQTGKGKTKLTQEQKVTKLRKQAIRAAKKKARRVQIETQAQEKEGQQAVTDKLLGPPDYQKILDEEIPD